MTSTYTTDQIPDQHATGTTPDGHPFDIARYDDVVVMVVGDETDELLFASRYDASVEFDGLAEAAANEGR